VIVEKFEDVPDPPGVVSLGAPGPPAPTTIGYGAAPQTCKHPVLNPPAPPPPPSLPPDTGGCELPPPPPPATTKYCAILVPGCVVNVVDPVVTDVTVHLPNDVGLITPTIPPLGDPISHYSCLKIF
jgi:hypothetical protein